MFVWLQVESNDGVLHRLFWNTLDGSEIPNNHLKYIKTPYHNDRFSISTGEFARFLFHLSVSYYVGGTKFNEHQKKSKQRLPASVESCNLAV